MFLSDYSNLQIYCYWVFWLVKMVVLIFFPRIENLCRFSGKKSGNILAHCECKHILLVSYLLRQGFKQSFASLKLPCTWAKEIKGWAGHQEPRLLLKACWCYTKVQGKGICFQVVGKFRVARHCKLFLDHLLIIHLYSRHLGSHWRRSRLSGILPGQVPQHG